MELYDDNSIIFTNNYNDIGSGVDSVSENEEEYNKEYQYVSLIVILPFILLFLYLFLCVIKYNIFNPTKKKIQKIKNNYNERKNKKTLPIYKKELNPSFIKELNKNNVNKVKMEENLVCSICLDEIDIEKYKEKKTDLVFLNCSHVYHKDCINTWVKEKVQHFNTPDCPYCRGNILGVNDIKINIQYSSDSSGYDTDDFYGI